MIEAIMGIVTSALKPITDLIDNLHTSKEEQMEMKAKLIELQIKLANDVMTYTQKTVDAQKEIIVAEIKSGWLSRNWRPILMLSIVAIIVNNYLLFPYLSMFTDKVTMLQLPDSLYTLMQIGIGGYVVGRSGEKIVETIKTNTKKEK